MCIDGASGRTVHVVCSQSALLGVDPCRGTWHGSQELPHELSWICFCFGFVSPSGKRFAFILLVYCTLSSYRCGYRCELRTPSRLPCFTLPSPCSRKFIILHCGGEGSFPHGLHGYTVSTVLCYENWIQFKLNKSAPHVSCSSGLDCSTADTVQYTITIIMVRHQDSHHCMAL